MIDFVKIFALISNRMPTRAFFTCATIVFKFLHLYPKSKIFFSFSLFPLFFTRTNCFLSNEIANDEVIGSNYTQDIINLSIV